jgi:hypothetical protein
MNHIQNIEELLQQALKLCQSGRFTEAKVLYEELLKSHPDQPKALTNLGAIEFQAGHFEAGLSLIQRSIQIDANQPYAFYNASNELIKLKRYDEALDYCNRAVALKPDFAEAYNNLGIASENLGHDNEALTNYDKAVALRPNYPEAHNNRGIILHHLKRYNDALTSYDHAISLKPDYAKAHNNRGNVLKDLKHPIEALTCYEQAIKLAPDFAEAYFNQGVLLASIERFNEAILSYDKAITLRPAYADAYCNRGYALQQFNNFEDALHSYNRAIELDDELHLAKWNKAFLLLLMGEYSRGWELYESRWQVYQKEFFRNFSQPLWLGAQPIAGKTLLIHAEQGLGDFIQFCRYVPLAEALGANVVLETPASMISLMNSLQGDFDIVEKHKPLPHFDLQCPVMSLPLAFHTTVQTIPANVPYLNADKGKRHIWETRLGRKEQLRVGLVWSGSAANKKRSIPLSQLEPLLQLPCEFHALQQEIGEEDALVSNRFKRLHLHHDELADFSDTAALIAEMDLIISIDTASAHLAGALGQPVWILLPFAPDFRWMADREDSPWYPSARLIRQTTMDDWDSVITNVANRLSDLVKEAPGGFIECNSLLE